MLKRSDRLQLAFVWNRTESVFDNDDCNLDKCYILRDLNAFASRYHTSTVQPHVVCPGVTLFWT